MTRRTAVAAPNQAAADAAVQVAGAGGGAVDAAVAACLVAMVTEPGVVSPLGGAFLTVAVPGHDPVTVDGNVEMPGRGAPPHRFGGGVHQVTTAYGGGVTLAVGHGTVATPGALAALGEAHRRWGRVPWPQVCAPAVEVSRRGFVLGPAAAHYLSLVHDDVYGWDPESRRAVHRPDGVTPLAAGETMRVEGLADTLEHLARTGPQDLYTGELAALLVAANQEGGGLVGAEDLRAYRARVLPALAVRAGRWTLGTNPPPAVGGPVLATLLALLQDGPRSGDAAVRHLVHVQAAVLRHRLDHLDVARDRVAAARALLDDVAARGGAWLRGAPSTVHVSVVDDAGLACAVTASSGYGSGAMVPGTGLWLNNCLGEPELNRRGLHAWDPGERLPSNMAPTVGRRDDGAVLAVGSPGADRITTAVAQVLEHLARGTDLVDAVAAPRLHVSLVPERAGAGGAGGSPEVLVEHEEDLSLPDLGLPTRSWPRHSMFFGGVTAALLRPGADGGRLSVAADPRRGGGTAVT
ncbi:gamma-glutamyltransferase [Thalassiella azotivora]